MRNNKTLCKRQWKSFKTALENLTIKNHETYEKTSEMRIGKKTQLGEKKVSLYFSPIYQNRIDIIANRYIIRMPFMVV